MTIINYHKYTIWKILAWLWLFSLFFSVPPVFSATEEIPVASGPAYSFEVSYKDAEDAVASALSDKGLEKKAAVFITGRQIKALNSFNQPVTLEVKGLQVDQQKRRWNASLLFVANNTVVTALPIAGRYEEMVQVPVLRREIRNGDVIGETDIEMRDFPLVHTRTDTISDIAGLIGKSPLRTFSASRPIRENEIARPAIVKKSTLVEMRYTTPGMLITTTGEAMNDGAKGDVINVRNVASKKIVRAVIEDPTTVNILAPNTQTSQLAGESYARN